MNSKLTIIILLFFYSISNAQIVDDSTTTNISFDQTKFFYKSDVYVGDTIRRAETQNQRFDIFRHSFVDTNLIQNLGMYGTAGIQMTKPYNSNLGSYDGISVYDYLAYQDKEVKYYDTKVPYSFFTFRTHAGGAQYIDGGYTQSVNEIANVGLQFKRTRTPKQIGANTENEVFSANTSLLFHASYLSKSGLYKALINYRYMKQDANEKGGITIDGMDSDSLIRQDFIETNIDGSISQEKRNEWSFYQEASPFKNGQIKVFHSLDRMKKTNMYQDNSVASNIDYYSNIYLDSTATLDSNVYRTIDNKIGFNGRITQISYSAYLKNRLWKYEADTNRTDTAQYTVSRKTENFFGGDIFIQSKDREYSGALNFEVGLDGSRKMDIVSDLKYLRFHYLDLNNKVYLRQQSFQENHFNWTNQFENYTVRDIKVEPYIETKTLLASAFINLQTYKNFVYYSEALVPIQDTDTKTGFLIGGHIGWNFKKFKVKQFVQYASMDELPFTAVPEIYTHTNFDYNFRVKRLPFLKANLGFDAFYFNAYKPLAYRSDLQSFVTQSSFEEEGYVILDAYINLRYKTFQLSMKGVNLLEGAARNSGYFPTVGYYGRRRGFEIGIKWAFFR